MAFLPCTLTEGRAKVQKGVGPRSVEDLGTAEEVLGRLQAVSVICTCV